MMRRAVLFALCLPLLSSLAQAQGLSFLYEEQGWTVYPLEADRCIAFNRLPEEFNNAPFNALAFKRRVNDATIEMTAYYWPQAFPADQSETELHIVGATRTEQTLPARVVNGFKAVVEATPEDTLRFISSEAFITIAAEGHTTPPLFFRTSAAAEALRQLELCAGSAK